MGIAGFCLGLFVLFEWLAGIEHLFMGILTMLLIVAGILTFMIGFISDMILGYHREQMRELRMLREKLDEMKDKE